MDFTALLNAMKPVLAQAARDGLRVIGTTLATHGFIENGAGTEAFIGAGMTIIGLFWGWFVTKGQYDVVALLKKLTATHTASAAIEAAKASPSVAAQVVNVLLVAFILSSFLAGGQAFAQTQRPVIACALASQNLDPLKLCGKLTGNAGADLQRLYDRIKASTEADLTYAIARATAANTTGSKVRLMCLLALKDFKDQIDGVGLKNPDGTPMVKPDPAMISTVEGVAELIDGLSPQGTLFTSCAGAAQMAKTNALQVVNAIVTGAAGLAAGGFVIP